MFSHKEIVALVVLNANILQRSLLVVEHVIHGACKVKCRHTSIDVSVDLCVFCNGKEVEK